MLAVAQFKRSGYRKRVTHPSRPPGFDMTYRPQEKFFGPPLSMRAIGLVHGGLALLVLVFVFTVEHGFPSSSAYQYMFQQKHAIDTHMAAGLFAASSVFSMLRDSMRGVQIRPNWIEYRELLSALWPRVRRYRWAQIESITFEESGSVSLDLWNGTREFLPRVRATASLKLELERLAMARAIPVRGGLGIEALDELPEVA